MLPRATDNTVGGHTRPAGLQLDHTVLNGKIGNEIFKEN